MKLAWGAVVTPEFRGRVIRIGQHVDCDPSHLMACMRFESRLDPGAVNPASGASGLIQFMPSTARALGTTVEAIRTMDAIAQLELVERYFAPFAGRLQTLADVYMAIFAPVAIGKPDDFVLYSSPSAAYVQNRSLDVDGDGHITKAEAASFPARALAEGWNHATDERDLRPDDAPQTQQTDRGEPMGPLLPFVIPILQTIAGQIPIISQILGPRGEVADRNVKLVQVAADTLTKAVGAVNLQQAAETIATDPKAAESARQALAAQPDVAAYLEHVAPILDKLAGYEQAEWTASEQSATNAFDRNQASSETPIGQDRVFWLSVAIVSMVCFVMISVLWKDAIVAAFKLGDVPGFSSDMQAFVIGAIVGAALTQVVQYFYGTNRQSAAKDQTIRTLANVRNPGGSQ